MPDYHNSDAALAFVDKIDPRDCRLKVGKEMFTFFTATVCARTSTAWF
ncbi:hypothetical protein ACLB1Q_07345 [Escherichia coli]